MAKKRETIIEKIGHIFDINVFLMLLLCISYIMSYKFLIEDDVAQKSFVNSWTIVLYITTGIAIIYSIYASIEVLRVNHPKLIKPLILLFLLFLSFLTIYNATFTVYYRGGYASIYFLIFVEIMMKLFSMLFFSIAISLVSYYMLLKSRNDKIKMIILVVLSLYLMIELHLLATNSTIATYTSKIELLASYFLSISVFNFFHIVLKCKNKKFWEKDTILGLFVFIICIVYIFIRDYTKLMNFFYENIFRETYDLILHYTFMIVLQFIFMILVIKNYKIKCAEKNLKKG